jgi:hypothetical protein
MVGGSNPSGSTTQSVINGDFLVSSEKRRSRGLARRRAVSVKGRLRLKGVLSGFVSGGKIPFPGKRRPRSQRPVRNYSTRPKTKYLMLPRPVGRQWGRRPWIAALTRSGARKASEIVMLTFRV